MKSTSRRFWNKIISFPESCGTFCISRSPGIRSINSVLPVFSVVIFLLTSCAPPATSTIFVPPTQPVPTLVLPTTTPIASPTSILPTTTPTTGPCTNDLNFIDDVTIEDGTIVSPGSSVDKQWLVSNSGSCNWDASYHMKWIGGDPLGAVTEQVLYPARAGSQATIRILFTAPTIAGTVQSAWQAYGPDGVPFGDPMYIEIVVTQ
jgi:hypothetical protein